ncbi:hypothetical protein [Halobacillus sp. H74]|uniref:hypothetical protein n=1 Tax=Halobacillus sp. H74 TaxID=3457436 RepID=UPI003FCDD2C8
MDQVLLFGVLLTLFSSLTIKKLKEETNVQMFFHISSLIIGLLLLILFSIQFSTFLE